jgi:hypothetical protein
MFYIGLDLGQSQDYTALAIAEKLEANKVIYHQIRYIQRYALGTTYPQITHSIKELMQKPPLLGKSMLIADATGVGRPVIDMMRKDGVSLVPVTITSGSEVKFDGIGGWNVPKRDLVSTVQVLLQNGRVKFASSLPDLQILVDELLNFRIKISQAGKDTYEAWREGAHDDLVLALALALWYSERFGVVGFPEKRKQRHPLEGIRHL